MHSAPIRLLPSPPQFAISITCYNTWPATIIDWGLSSVKYLSRGKECSSGLLSMLSKKKTNTFTLKFMAALGRHDKNASKGWTIQDSINRNAYFS